MDDLNILIVEDEKKIVDILRDYLEGAGFRVSSLERGDQAVAYVKMNRPDLVLLDLMLPGKDGMEICREVRQFSSVPIIMITAKVEETDRLEGLNLGADDYICKPFLPREVVARVKAVLRRTRLDQVPRKLVIGPIVLDEETREVSVNGRVVELTRSEFALMRVLMSRPNRVFSRNELIHLISGFALEGYDRTIDTHIKNLRKKIAEKIPDQELISAIYGAGYKLKPFSEPD